MYFPSDQACNVQNSESPISPDAIAAAQALTAADDASVVFANQAWQNLLTRRWQDFASLGPNVAIGVQNAVATPGGSIISPLASASPPSTSPNPAGISVVSQGNPDGSNPAAGGSGGSWHWSGRGKGARFQPGRGGRGNPAAEFVALFGASPVLTFTGQPSQLTGMPAGSFPGSGPGSPGTAPQPGSVLSLVYGGQNQPVPAFTKAFGPAGTPDPRTGYSTTTCPADPAGIAMLPWGEPAYANPAGGGSAAGYGGSGVGFALLALLGLAGAAYFTDRNDKRKGRA